MIHVFPAWQSAAPADRAEALLAAVYDAYGRLNVAQSQAHAAMARAQRVRYIPLPPPV